MKTLIFSLLITISTFFCQKDTKIKIERDEFIISYPSELILDENIQGRTSFVLTTHKNGQEDAFIENINLVIKNLESNITLDELSKQTKNEISKIADIIEDKKLKINEKDCYRIILKATQNGIDLTFIQHYYIENQKIYLLTFSSETRVYNDYFNQMNKVLMSFEIK